MRCFVYSLVFLASGVVAQPRAFLEVKTDAAAYAAGEPIHLTVSITNPEAETVTYWSPSGCPMGIELDGEDIGEPACSLAEFPIPIDPGKKWFAEYTLYPDSTGLPRTDGAHSLVVMPYVRVYTTVTPGGAIDPSRTFAPEALSFSAPASTQGVIRVNYPPELDPDGLDGVRDSLKVRVLERDDRSNVIYERWHVRDTPLAEIETRYATDERFGWFEAESYVTYPAFGFATDTESAPEAGIRLSGPFPNPCGVACSVTLETETVGEARVTVVDMLGREAAVLHDGPLAGGSRVFALPLALLRSGLYVVRAQTVSETAQVRAVLVR